jgi:hypothetical protein
MLAGLFVMEHSVSHSNIHCKLPPYDAMGKTNIGKAMGSTR